MRIIAKLGIVEDGLQAYFACDQCDFKTARVRNRQRGEYGYAVIALLHHIEGDHPSTAQEGAGMEPIPYGTMNS